MFTQRLNDAAIGYVVAGSPGEHEGRTAAGRTAREAFSAIWSPTAWFE
jgi:hypothetical protein